MPLDLAAVVVPKASDVLAARLRELILSSGLAEGTPLPPERELVAQSGLSRASVREALRVLETEGLVLTRAGRNGGSQVRRPGRESISRSFELFVRSHGVRFEALLEAREAIEPAAAALAAIHRHGRRSRRDDAHSPGARTGFRRRRRACAAQPAVAPRDHAREPQRVADRVLRCDRRLGAGRDRKPEPQFGGRAPRSRACARPCARRHCGERCRRGIPPDAAACRRI